jgi:hypothetical protein
MKGHFVDYIYYRFNKFYFHRDGRNGTTSVMALGFIWTFIVFDILIILARILGVRDKLGLLFSGKNIGFFFAGSFVALSVFFYFKYKDKYNFYKKNWKDEPEDKYRLRGWIVIVFFLAPLIVAFFL